MQTIFTAGRTQLDISALGHLAITRSTNNLSFNLIPRPEGTAWKWVYLPHINSAHTLNYMY